jgi:hypothetical protein
MNDVMIVDDVAVLAAALRRPTAPQSQQVRGAEEAVYAPGEGHRGDGRAHANGLAQNARSGQLVYDQGIRQLQRLAAAGANSKAGDR